MVLLGKGSKGLMLDLATAIKRAADVKFKVLENTVVKKAFV